VKKASPGKGKRPKEAKMPSAYELATLAARINPGLCQQAPGDAIAAGMKLVESVQELIDSKRARKELLEAAQKHDVEDADNQSSIFAKKFEKGVELIVREKRPERALPWFKKFLKSKYGKAQVQRYLETYRKNRFSPGEIQRLRDEFAQWKVGEKSSIGKQSRSFRKKH
jgi:hypothetical protein